MLKPAWLKQKITATPQGNKVRKLLENLGLNTVCEEAKCPNRNSCFSEGTATFLIMGSQCTRHCTFCNIGSGAPEELDPDEPENLAKAAKEMNLKHVVITSVTRDDLPDGGANHFARTITMLNEVLPETTIEVLIPDFLGNFKNLNTVLNAGPDVLNHNVETIPQLYSRIRPEADYQRSLDVLRESKSAGFITKTGIMVGLGETDDQVRGVLDDIAEVEVDIVTIGQYLQPSPKHCPVDRFVLPEIFAEYEEYALSKGIKKAVSGPLVRSSYRAGTVLKEVFEM